jgi:hypothetical protein
MRSYVRPAGLVLTGGALALGLAACGSSSPSTAKVAASTSPSRGTRSPGATGKVVAVSGASFTVQGQASTTDVSYTSATTFEKTSTVPITGLQKGECVTIIGTPSTAGGALTARTVTARPSTGASCTAVNGAGGGFAGFGGGRSRPSGAPTGRPSGAPSGAAGRGGFGRGAGGAGGSFLTGSVVSVTATDLVVDGVERTVSAGAAASPTSSPAATNVTVAVSSSSTVTQTSAATSGDVAVGSCVTATGQAGAASTTSSTLTLAANRVTLSSPTNGSCSTTFGFGGRGFGGGQGAGQGSGQGATGA